MKTQPRFLFREAEEKDLHDILEIMNDAILNTTSIYDYHARTFEYVAKWFRQKHTDKMPVFVCEADSRAVGYGSYGLFRAWDGYRFSVEHSIYVHANYRGLGIGKQLMARLIDSARSNGYHTMIAGIDANNRDSCKFHQQFGFFEVARMKEVGFKFDRWLDLVFMQLMLDGNPNKE